MAETAASEASPAPAIQIAPGDGKAEIRNKVWDYLTDNRLASFPFPPHRRISNFKGAEAAGDQVLTLEVFKSAKNIKVDPDKPLQQVRFRTLEAGKMLIVPTPKLRTGLLNHIKPPADAGVALLKACATRQGVDEYSEPVGLDDEFHIDLIIVGCVAVSPTGWRIGKGAGFSDMEYAMMVSIGAVDSSVPVVTVVHDCQVLDLPDILFGPHDLPVNYIVTPTRVIQCEGVSTRRPPGMIWSLLDAERISHIPILGRLRYREWKAGKNVMLDGETEPPMELMDVAPTENDDEEGTDTRRPRVGRRRPPRRPRQDERGEMDRSGDEGKVNGVDGAVKSGPGDERPRPRYRRGGGGRRPRQFARRATDHDRTSESEKDASTDRNESSDYHQNRPVRGGRRFRRGFGRRYRGGGRRPAHPAENGDMHDGTEEDAGKGSGGGGRSRRRERVSESDGDASGGGGGRRVEGRGGPRRRGGGGYGYRRRYFDDCEGSVYVGSLPRSVRVSEFKAEVRDRDVQPLRVVWRGQSGFAFLNFRTVEDAEHALSALEGLHISDRSLRLEMAKSQAVGGGGRRRRNASPSRSDGGGDDGAQSDEA